eukprot:Unigene10496_Nuclearia_a/m.32091 Unigene10496_Nuclearia_a/g.32091  ORF Unigene10496_Nuclearia_a/g.32091 Unigene10496_Nuclearia_a/m.32091 type:complete len:315 (+) Unigene10496_Nuclearia_a:53-997(+)
MRGGKRDLSRGKLFRMRERQGKRQLQPGMAAIVVTCPRGREAQTVRELYTLLGEYIEDAPPDAARESDGDDEAEEDAPAGDADARPPGEETVEDALQKELASLRGTSAAGTPAATKPRLMSLHVDMDCVVIMRVPHHADPVNVVARIMHDVDTTRRAKTRFCLRFTPLTRVCRATDDDVEAMARDLLAPFREEAHPPTRFMIVYNARNSQCLKRNDVIKAVARAMGTQHKVDLDKPEVVILVEAIKSMCGIGVVRDYHRYKRFNVVQLLEPAPTAPAAPAASAKRPASPGPSDDEASKRPSTDAVAVPQVAHAL